MDLILVVAMAAFYKKKHKKMSKQDAIAELKQLKRKFEILKEEVVEIKKEWQIRSM